MNAMSEEEIGENAHTKMALSGYTEDNGGGMIAEKDVSTRKDGKDVVSEKNVLSMYDEKEFVKVLSKHKVSKNIINKIDNGSVTMGEVLWFERRDRLENFCKENELNESDIWRLKAGCHELGAPFNSVQHGMQHLKHMKQVAPVDYDRLMSAMEQGNNEKILNVIDAYALFSGFHYNSRHVALFEQAKKEIDVISVTSSMGKSENDNIQDSIIEKKIVQDSHKMDSLQKQMTWHMDMQDGNIFMQASMSRSTIRKKKVMKEIEAQ